MCFTHEVYFIFLHRSIQTWTAHMLCPHCDICSLRPYLVCACWAPPTQTHTCILTWALQLHFLAEELSLSRPPLSFVQPFLYSNSCRISEVAAESSTTNNLCNYATSLKTPVFSMSFSWSKEWCTWNTTYNLASAKYSVYRDVSLDLFSLPVYYLNQRSWRRYKSKSSCGNDPWIKLRMKRIHSIVIWAHTRNWIIMLDLSNKPLY